jgi:pimeloyl-ACP methyl ester carboxylesterase
MPKSSSLIIEGAMEDTQLFVTETVLVDDLRITCHLAGVQGSHLILLHGGRTDSALLSWRYALPGFAKEHRVLAFDWPIHIESPALFVHGDNDRLVPIAEIRKVAESMPDARLEVLENTGHWAQREHPAQFNQLLLDFF